MRISLSPALRRQSTHYPTMEGGCMSSSSPRMRRRRVPVRIAHLSRLGMSRVRQPRAEFNRASLPVFPRWNPQTKDAAAVRINLSLRWILCRSDTRYGVGVAGGSCSGLDCSLGEYGSIRQWAASWRAFNVATTRWAAATLTLRLHGSWRSPLNQLHYSP